MLNQTLYHPILYTDTISMMNYVQRDGCLWTPTQQKRSKLLENRHTLAEVESLAHAQKGADEENLF